jgi:tight adherence protein C
MTFDFVPIIFACFAGLGTFLVGLIVADWLTGTASRFNTQFEAEADTQDQSARTIRALGTTFGALAAPFETTNEQLDLQLTYAGRPYGGVSGGQYLAATFVISIGVAIAVTLFMLGTATLGGGAASEAIGNALKWGLFIGICTAVFLYLDVQGNANRISDELEREFPFFLDLAVLVVQAGGTPRKALSKYVEASPGTPLAREIAITAKDADSTSFEDALYRMVDRVRPVSVKTILKNLAQGEKSSGEAEEFYTAQAEELRFLREEMASRTAERLKTNIVFPVFLMTVSIIIAALAPTVVSISSQGLF